MTQSKEKKDNGTSIPVIAPETFGDESFKRDYHVKYALCAGAMAGGIASTDMVCAMGKEGFMGSFGAGGLSIPVIEQAIDTIQAQLPENNYMVNMLAQRNEELEIDLAEMLIRKGVPAVEASAYTRMSEGLVLYRVSGLKQLENGEIVVPHKVMAKVSREEVFQLFMAPPEPKIVDRLLQKGKITEQEAELAKYISMASDITVEGDSGGHTDRRPLIAILPGMIALRDRLQEQYQYKKKVRVGAGGGIGTGLSALGAFMMGASYIVTGSVNQSCVESGTSDYVKNVLKDVTMADVVLAPCADLFEFGGKVQVTKRGNMYAQNANKLYEYYSKYSSFYEIPEKEREKIESRILKEKYDVIWESTKEYFMSIGQADKIEKDSKDPKKQMALVFRWYLGKSSKWAIQGNEERKMDMQIWCGAALGAFNSWVKGTYLEAVENRKIADVSYQILNCAAFYYRRQLSMMNQSEENENSTYKIEKENGLW